MFSTIILDVINLRLIRKTIEGPSGTNSRSRLVQAARKKREAISKRATAINTMTVLVPWIAIAIFLSISNLVLSGEMRVMAIIFMLTVINGLRNPIITMFGCQVNQQIRLESVEDRQQREIDDAIERRGRWVGHQTILQAQDVQEVHEVQVLDAVQDAKNYDDVIKQIAEIEEEIEAKSVNVRIETRVPNRRAVVAEVPDKSCSTPCTLRLYPGSSAKPLFERCRLRKHVVHISHFRHIPI